MHKKIYFAIEGNIGSGKSTLLSTIQRNNPGNIEAIQEPVKEYSSFTGIGNIHHNPLQESYTDSLRSAGFAQLHILHTSGKYYRRKYQQSQCSTVVSERSILSPAAFIKAQKQVGNLSAFVADYLEKELGKVHQDSADCFPDYIIFLDASPELCSQRIDQRSRSEEQGVSMTYLHAVDKCLKEYFLRKSQPETVVIKIDENTSPDKLYSCTNRIIHDLGAWHKKQKK